MNMVNFASSKFQTGMSNLIPASKKFHQSVIEVYATTIPLTSKGKKPTVGTVGFHTTELSNFFR